MEEKNFDHSDQSIIELETKISNDSRHMLPSLDSGFNKMGKSSFINQNSNHDHILIFY